MLNTTVPMIPEKHQHHYCYILEVVGDRRYNYIGYTVNMARRIRQHNGELVGGARITSRKSVLGHRWRVIALVTSTDFDHCRALSCEWWIKHPSGRRRGQGTHSGSVGRIQGLAKALANAKFVCDRFTVWTVPEYRAGLEAAMRQHGSTFPVLELTSLTPHLLATSVSETDTIEPETVTDMSSESTLDF